MNRKMGRFKLAGYMFERHLEEIQFIFAYLKIVPFEIIGSGGCPDSFTYTAYGEFPEVEDLSIIPEYLLLVTREDGKLVSASVQRVVVGPSVDLVI